LESKTSLSKRRHIFLAGTVLANPWIPNDPFPKQAEFLTLDEEEAFYGGAAGGGKSEALLMAAAQYVDVPGYAALILRRTYADLSLPGAIMDRAHSWWRGKAQWNDDEKTYTFPSGATITFGYLETENHKYRYQGAELQFIAFDELTQFTETQYTYLHSRTRRLASAAAMGVPIRMRSASNPGGLGAEWVKRYFIDEAAANGVVFIPARLDDNPALDQAAYRHSLNKLDPVTREQLLNGDWTIRVLGATFRREWFAPVEKPVLWGLGWPAGIFDRVTRAWDLAAVSARETAQKRREPDFTVGSLLARTDSLNPEWWMLDQVRFQCTPGETEKRIQQVATHDRTRFPANVVEIYMEQEPGSSGLNVIEGYRTRVLAGHVFQGVPASGKKELRAYPFSQMAEAGYIKIVRCMPFTALPFHWHSTQWHSAFFDEAEMFPNGMHDDQIDAWSLAFQQLTIGAELRMASASVASLFRYAG
jgi:predicted phage terminase large subunit-like protein